MTVIATGFDGRFRRERRERGGARRPSGRLASGSASGRPGATEGFDVPAEVLEVPSFLRDD